METCPDILFFLLWVGSHCIQWLLILSYETYEYLLSTRTVIHYFHSVVLDRDGSLQQKLDEVETEIMEPIQKCYNVVFVAYN